MSTLEYAKRHNRNGLCRNCPSPLAEGSKVYCGYHKDKNKIYSRDKERRLAVRLKNEILEHYGKQCGCCGENIVAFLTIEHEEGNGNNHRKELFKYNVGGVHMYRWLKKNNFPDGYNVLRMNCNWGKRLGGKCPHKNQER